MTYQGKKLADDQSSPTAKATRLKRIRNFANLNRRDLSKRSGINLHTYRGWEVGRHGGLSHKGAEKLVTLAAEAGVVCTIEWLLYGIGAGPQLIDRCRIQEDTANYSGGETCSFRTSKKRRSVLINELKAFRMSYQDTIDMFVQDDWMLPYYKPGELVAGVKHFDDEILRFCDENCIIQTASGLLLLRQLRVGSQPNRYHLVCLNASTSVEEPLIYNAELISAAPVVWQRRKSTLL